jgi:hypothetical protein
MGTVRRISSITSISLTFRVRLRRTKKEASPELLITRSLWPTRRVIKETVDTSLRGWSGSHDEDDDDDDDRKLQRREKNTAMMKLY